VRATMVRATQCIMYAISPNMKKSGP
jgi:hypothetical protein